MKTNLQKNWVVVLFNGLLAILFGILAISATETTMLGISVYFGLIVLIGGILLLLGAWDLQRKEKNYSLMLTEGVISAVLGILIMVFPGQTLKLFYIFVGIWAIFLGLLKIYIAIILKKMNEFRYMLIIGGILLFVIGLLFLLNPDFIAGMVIKIIGGIFILVGMMLVYFSFTVRNASEETV